MATGGPTFQEILEKSGPIFLIRARPFRRALIADKDALFSTLLPSFLQGG